MTLSPIIRVGGSQSRNGNNSCAFADPALYCMKRLSDYASRDASQQNGRMKSIRSSLIKLDRCSSCCCSSDQLMT